jgi:hypothetical protein
VSDVAVVGGAWVLVTSVLLLVWLVSSSSCWCWCSVCKSMVDAVPGDDCATEVVAGGGGCGTTDAACVSVTAGGEQGWQNDDRFHSRGDGSDSAFIYLPCPHVSTKFQSVWLDF